MALAGGLRIGDKVICSNGEAATIVGQPARWACRAFSVCVRYDSSGILKDERASNLVLQIDGGIRTKPETREDVRQDFVDLAPPRIERPSQQQALPTYFFQTGSFADIKLGKGKAMKPNDKAICVRITHLLNHKDVLKREVLRCFDEVDVNHRGVLSIQGLMDLCEKIQRVTLVPSSAFGNFPDTYARFDFNGDGTLDKIEAYKCIKYCLKAHRKALDGHPVPDVPYVAMGPSQLGYRTVKVLASGGQGTASLVQDSGGMEYVLKSYDKNNANAEGIDELRDEMEAMLAMDKCPYIATCIEIFQDSTYFYMVSHMNHGGDWEGLKDRAIQQGVPLTDLWYKSLFGQAFLGLEHMHRHAMMHCDIKEKNLMVRNSDLANPEVVIIDLGLAHALFDEGGVFGTPGYIPPETWETGKWFPRGDVFSMGVVCFQLLTDQTSLFVEGARTMGDVSYFTQNRQPRYGKIGNNHAIMEWLPKTLEKRRDLRLKSKQVLGMRWFAEPETWLPFADPDEIESGGLAPYEMEHFDEILPDGRGDVKVLTEEEAGDERAWLDDEASRLLGTAWAPSHRGTAQPIRGPAVNYRPTYQCLAGGLCPGDLVFCTRNGRFATVIGHPARKTCLTISVAVRYHDTGAISDERVATLELQPDTL